MRTNSLNNSFSLLSYKNLNRIGRYIATIAAILFLAIPQSVWAETKTVGPFTATADNQWKNQFNSVASPYMSITTLNNDASITNGGDRYLTPQGTGTNVSGFVTFTLKSGIYLD